MLMPSPVSTSSPTSNGVAMANSVSTPRAARSRVPRSSKSPLTMVAPSVASAAAAGDSGFLVSARTECPRSSSSRARWPPCLPVAPVTSTFNVLDMFFSRLRCVERLITSRERAFLDPVDEEQALGKRPRAISLYECVRIPQCGDHQTSLVAVDREMMSECIRVASGSPLAQHEDGALSDEVHGRGVPVQVIEHRSECIARMQFLRWHWILRVHVHDEMRVRREQRHLTLGVAAVGAVRVGLDQLPYGEAIRGFGRRYGDVLAHSRSTNAALGMNL